MTVVVTRNSPDRVRGFLASCMLEIAPGVYTSPRMNPGIRERVWQVIELWFDGAPETAVVMTYEDRTLPGGQAIRTLGVPRREVVEHHGIYLARRDLSQEESATLTTELTGSKHPERDPDLLQPGAA